ncbi:MAG: T9SS type A sorting domain-containing protein [Bacteroidetes bacterium]|nr:T9SS type A sorting domain-containing protein [Bacteroidota bacterium]
MRLKLLLSAALLSLSVSSFAQGPWLYDSVSMGAGYANDYYYGLAQGTKAFTSGTDWDLAFQTTVFGELSFNATVRANHARKGVEVFTLHLQASTHFGNMTPADTVGRTGSDNQLFNVDTSWGTGAFYQNRRPENAFDYGWGAYDMTTHYLNGDSLYLIKVGGVSYQFWLEQYISYPEDSISYKFHIAQLDNSNSHTIKLYRTDPAGSYDFSNRLFAYYDIASNNIVNHEQGPRSSWDMLFTKYMTPVPGPNGIQEYEVTGVLMNLSREVAKVEHLNPDDINAGNYQNYTRSTLIDAIGYDWKTFVNPGPNGYYQLNDSDSYIIKSHNGNGTDYWQLQFTRFDGSSTGDIVFRKRLLTTVGVAEINNNKPAAISIAPNPANNQALLMLDAQTTASAQMLITDMAGRVLRQEALNLKSGINAFSLNTANWPAGIYAVQVAAQGWKLSSRIVVAH